MKARSKKREGEPWKRGKVVGVGELCAISPREGQHRRCHADAERFLAVGKSKIDWSEGGLQTTRDETGMAQV